MAMTNTDLMAIRERSLKQADFSVSDQVQCERDRADLIKHIEAQSARLAAVEAALVELSSAVFGDKAGDEPNVYADYDKLVVLERKCRAAAALRAIEEGK